MEATFGADWIFIPCCLRTNPVGVAVARRAVEEVLADQGFTV